MPTEPMNYFWAFGPYKTKHKDRNRAMQRDTSAGPADHACEYSLFSFCLLHACHFVPGQMSDCLLLPPSALDICFDFFQMRLCAHILVHNNCHSN
jgi:hypothetical protein